jgi:hypothetical protein
LAAQIPDEPTNLIEKPGETTSTQIGLSWDAPNFNGGSPILDYRIWYDNGLGGTENFVELATVSELTYLATGLTQGNLYQFYVESRNLYGYST